MMNFSTQNRCPIAAHRCAHLRQGTGATMRRYRGGEIADVGEKSSSVRRAYDRKEDMEKQQEIFVSFSIESQKALFVDVCHRHAIEACGVLLGLIDDKGNWHVEEAIPLRNIFDSPVYFEFAPEDLLRIELEYGERVIGVYHSHPTGYARASDTDEENMKRVNMDEDIPWVWCIIQGPFTDAFVRRHKGRITDTTMRAYHHYASTGLRQIAIRIEENDELLRSDEYDK